MKTKFILHGGFHKGQEVEDNSKFYAEILKDAPQSAKVLIVPFAKDSERIIPTTQRVIGEFNQVKQDKNLSFEVANEQSFTREIEQADIVYFQGGKTLKLLEALKKFPNLKDSLGGKIVAGESAGANVFGEFFYSPSADKVDEGLGFLPVKIIPHYSDEFKGKLDNVGDNLDLLLLKEYEFKIF